ncbi:DUF5712 family protein [Chryseobacterium shandongense]|jgi:hypothetical protein|nr:DUF5712 family protein [Chryseobacterium shandongense]
MHVKIVSHDAKKSQSASNIMQYLDKENEKEKLKNEHLILEGKENEINPNSVEYFFNQDYNPYDLEDPNSKINVFEAADNLDKNRGTQNLSSSNFYMLNISPSQQELEHMEKIAIEELTNRGLIFEDIRNIETALDFYNEQKDQLMKLQMKLFTQEVMEQYASQMDREIYANQEALPTDAERKLMKAEIEERFTKFLEDKGIKSGILQPDVNYLGVSKFNEKQEYPHGKIFTFYSSDIEKKIDLFVPEGKYKIEDEQLFIDEEYYSDKYNTIVERENFRNEKIEIPGIAVKSTDYFTDYVKEDKVYLMHQWDEFDKELKLYFDSNEIQMRDGVCYIPESIYNDKLYEAKSQFLSKKFAEIKKSMQEENIKESGFDISKEIDQNGEEFYLNPDKVPSKDDLKKINIKTSVDFNNYLVEKKYIPKKESFKISDWETKKSIKAEVLAESEKAKLLKINDERMPEPVQVWVGNFAIVDKESNDLVKDENGDIQILSDFYEHKIQEILKLETAQKLQFIDFKEIESQKPKFVKNEESISFTFDNTGLKDPLKFNIRTEELTVSANGSYTIERNLFDHKYEKHLIYQAQKEFSKDFEKIKESVHKEMIQAKDFQKDKEIEQRFKNFLVEKNVIREQSKNDNFKVDARILETKYQSTYIAYKRENSLEEIRLWVNNNIISKSEKDGIYFKNEAEITKILDKAIQRDTARKQLVEIYFSKVETEDKKHKEESYKSFNFYKNVPGLSEPVKISFKESDLKQDGDKYFVEKHKLDYKLENAIKFGITKEFGNVKDDIKNEVWKEKGFDTTKRKITGKDLLYYAKIETERKYSYKDKAVVKNKPILTKIKEYQQSRNPLNKMKIADLESQLLRDKYTGEIINEGVKKGGMNYHSHIVVSRHDKISTNPKDKVSMSPNANQKDGQVNNGAKVGFNRDEFAKTVEKVFDEKFEYERPEKEKYAVRNQMKKDLSKKVADRARGEIKGRIKQEIMKHTGMNTVRNELNPSQKIRNELKPLPIPTSFPKSKLDAVIKIVKMAKNLIVDKGMHY